MSIRDCYPMRKRRSLDKTPGRSTKNEAGRLNTPRRITSNHPLAEQGLDVIWDNNSPSPTRTLLLGKRKKPVGSDSSSSGGEISDLVKKLADKTGQTPTNNSLLNYWLEEDTSQSDAVGDKNDSGQVKTGSKKKSQLKTPCRRPRELRKSRRNKHKLSKELEMIASMMQDTENVSTRQSTSTSPSSSIILKPIKTENNTCTAPHSSDKDETNITKPTSSNAKLRSPPLPSVDDFDDDFNWEDEEGDVILSQVDISALYDDHVKNEVSTNTQLFDVKEESNQTAEFKLETEIKDENSNLDSSFVTESWEFDDDLDDEDNLLQTALDEVERTQSIVNNIPSTSKTDRISETNDREKNNIFASKNDKVEHLESKSMNTKEENIIKFNKKELVKVKPPQSYLSYTKVKSTIKYAENNKILEEKKSRIETSKRPLFTKEKSINYKEKKNVLEEKNPNIKVEPSQSKTLYSKEEIERKKRQAQLRLKQKQKTLANTKLNVQRSKRI